MLVSASVCVCKCVCVCCVLGFDCLIASHLRRPRPGGGRRGGGPGGAASGEGPAPVFLTCIECVFVFILFFIMLLE